MKRGRKEEKRRGVERMETERQIKGREGERERGRMMRDAKKEERKTGRRGDRMR